MYSYLVFWIVTFVAFVDANVVNTTLATSSSTQPHISLTSFTQRNISVTEKGNPIILIDRSDTRIVGGFPVSPYSWPYLVHVNTSKTILPYIYTKSCGGAVYNESYVITAAHCVYNLASEEVFNLKVIAGEHSISRTEGHEQIRRVSKIIIHPGFIYDILKDDIALLKLSTPLDLRTGYVSSIELNNDNSCPASNARCSVAGWGKLYEGGPTADVPSEIAIPVISNHDCNMIEYDLYYNNIFDYNICAGYMMLGGQDICRGDSGGPLVCTCGGKSTHAGIVSWVPVCASQYYPAVYTRTSCYVQWIESGFESFECYGKNSASFGNSTTFLCVLYWCALYLFIDRLK